jgi:hypothetical protein
MLGGWPSACVLERVARAFKGLARDDISVTVTDLHRGNAPFPTLDRVAELGEQIGLLSFYHHWDLSSDDAA